MNRETRIALGVIALVTLSALLQFTGLSGILRYDRSAISAGEVWRLLSGHLVHLGPSHLALNATGLALVALLVGRWLSLRAWTGVLLICAFVTGAGLWWLMPEVRWYVGLSGVLHGLLAAGALHAAWHGRERGFHVILLALLALKLAWEQYTGPLPGTARLAGGTVIIDAHLFGALGGALASLLIVMMRRLAPPFGRNRDRRA